MEKFNFLDEVILDDSEMLEICGGASDNVGCGKGCGNNCGSNCGENCGNNCGGSNGSNSSNTGIKITISGTSTAPGH